MRAGPDPNPIEMPAECEGTALNGLEGLATALAKGSDHATTRSFSGPCANSSNHRLPKVPSTPRWSSSHEKRAFWNWVMIEPRNRRAGLKMHTVPRTRDVIWLAVTVFDSTLLLNNRPEVGKLDAVGQRNRRFAGARRSLAGSRPEYQRLPSLPHCGILAESRPAQQNSVRFPYPEAICV